MPSPRHSAEVRVRDRDRLTAAIRKLKLEGREPPCAHDPRFSADDQETRAEVLEVCHDCDILAACHAAGRHEQHGVWGAMDRTQKAPMPARSAS